MINPMEIPAFPNLFTFNKGTGYLEVDSSACIQAGVDEVKLNRAIEILNLNCERLARQRRDLVVNIDKNEKTLRSKRCRPEDMPSQLVRRYFTTKWPKFFTTLRCCLGQTAEEYLNSIVYAG